MSTIFKYLTTMLLVVGIVFCTSSFASACGNYAVFIYKITKVENGQYWGSGVSDSSNIYFVEENIFLDITNKEIAVGDIVIAYFDPDNTVDGLIGIERTEGVRTETALNKRG